MNDTAARQPSGAPAGPPPGSPAPPPWQGAPPMAPPAVAPPLTPEAERGWAMAAHLSSFVAAYVALGFLGPLVVLLVAGNRSPFVRRHAVEALNFNLSWLLYIVVAGILSFMLIGIPALVALAIAYAVLVVVATVEASGRRDFRYPLTIRFVS
jgi:uncharacterized Tic20 family protein